MFYNEHLPPHFHARYGGQEASIRIGDLEILKGSLSPRAIRLVKEWAKMYKSELLQNWEKARQKRKLLSIDPLK